MLLKEFLAQLDDEPKDVDLYHWDYDEESATMVECCLKAFTAEGQKEFEKVLNAKVERVTPESKDWVSVYVTGVKYREVERMSLSQAGYCSLEDYEKWFREV
jgi:hypothetical protein